MDDERTPTREEIELDKRLDCMTTDMMARVLGRLVDRDCLEECYRQQYEIKAFTLDELDEEYDELEKKAR